MFRRMVASAVMVSFGLVHSSAAFAQQSLFPVLDCWEEASDTEVRLQIGVTNMTDQEITNPSNNVLMVEDDAYTPPTIFKPGYIPRTLTLVIPKTVAYVTWELGQQDYPLYIGIDQLYSTERCSNEAGVPGATGPAGPAGPAGESAGQLLPQCDLVTASLPEGKDHGTELLITCDPDETLMQGGGVCGKGNLRGSFQVNATTWKIVCRSPKGIQGSALCCPQD